MIYRDCLYPTCPGCGWVNTQPEYIDWPDFDVCNTARVSCLKCGIKHTVTRQTVFTYTTESVDAPSHPPTT